MPQSTVTKTLIRGAIALVVVTVLWEAASLLVAPFLWPGPASVLPGLVRLFTPADLLRHTMTTFREFLAGYTIAAIVGVPLGVALAYSQPVRLILGTLIWSLAATPLVALAPLMAIWFGPTETVGKATLAFIAAVFPIACAIMEKTNSGIGRTIVSGLRVGVSPALLAVVICEMFASTAGLGYVMLTAGASFDVAMLMSAYIAAAILGVMLTRILTAIEMRLP
jgi:ABC-type nitrate/sulfonate/bicarbonate transport system permease component